MLKIKKVTVREVFESDSWILVKIMQGSENCVRIDARRRFPVPDISSFFCEWCSNAYADRLAVCNYNKKLIDLNCYSY